MKSYTLLINSEDRKGLIYQVSKVLFDNNLNISKNNEFVDQNNNKFFMRTEFTGNLSECKIVAEKLEHILPKTANILLKEKKKKNIIILATKEYHCIGDILIRYKSGELEANILSVISNHKILEELVSNMGVPYHYISHENINREDHEDLIINKINEFKEVDYIILAKYMRILTPKFVDEFKNKIINIHHSFLPAFIGANPYKQAYERGVKIIGATAHFVTKDLDEGPIISQDTINVDHTYNWKDMRKSGRYIEKTVLSKAIDLTINDKVFINGNRTVIL